MLLFARREVFGFAQVGEWLKPTDCKSVPLRRYGGSNPPLCTRVAKEKSFKVARFQSKSRALGFLETLKPCDFATWNLVDDQEEVRAGDDRVCGTGRAGLDNAAGRSDTSLQCERETADRDAGDPGTVRVSRGAVLLADADRGGARGREAGGLIFLGLVLRLWY